MSFCPHPLAAIVRGFTLHGGIQPGKSQLLGNQSTPRGGAVVSWRIVQRGELCGLGDGGSIILSR